MKKNKIISISICVLVCIICVLAMKRLESKKENDIKQPVEDDPIITVTEGDTSVAESTGEEDASDGSTSTEEHTEEADEKNTIWIYDEYYEKQLKVTFISYEVVRNTELSQQTKYPAEYFYDEKNTDYDEYGENYACFFLKCKIKNINQEHKVTSDMNLRMSKAYSSGRADLVFGSMFYFDKSQHTEGEDRIHQYFWYTFDEGEELDCTIGFIVGDYVDDGTEKYYVGGYPSAWDNKKETEWCDEDLESDANVIAISEIKEGND